jgi:hypothetical protein
MNTATAAGAAAVVAPIVAWIATLFHQTLPADVLSAIVVLLVAGAHWVGNVIAERTASKPAAGQGGFASPRLLVAIAAIAIGAAVLGGCTTTTASTYRGFAAQAEAGVKMWDDNTLATLQAVLCAQPYSAIQRHPELQPGVAALCGPLSNVSNLDANQLAMLIATVKSAGFNLQPAPTAAAASAAK